MGKIYEGVWGCVFKLSHIRGNGGPGIGTEGRFSVNLIYRGDGGGQCINGIRKKRYGGAGCFGDYIKNNLFIVDL